MNNPQLSHQQAAKRLLWYLKQTIQFGLKIQQSSSHTLQAFSDADWAGCCDDRQSTSGFCVYLGKNLISWSCKKQATVAHSSTKAEYKSLANTAVELSQLKSLLFELGVDISIPPVLWCNSIRTKYLASNPIFHARTKHVEIDYHFVQDMAASKSIDIWFISTKDQVVDVFTKPLSASRFSTLCNKLKVVAPSLSLRGCVKDNPSSIVLNSNIQDIQDKRNV